MITYPSTMGGPGAATPPSEHAFPESQIQSLVFGGGGRWLDIQLSGEATVPAGNDGPLRAEGATLRLRGVRGLRYVAAAPDDATAQGNVRPVLASARRVADGLLDLGAWGRVRWLEAELSLVAETGAPHALAKAGVGQSGLRLDFVPTALHDACIDRIIVSTRGEGLRVELSLLTLLARVPQEPREQIFECSAVLVGRRMQGLRLDGFSGDESDREGCVWALYSATAGGTQQRLHEIYPGSAERLGPALVRLQGDGGLSWQDGEIALGVVRGSLEHVGSMPDDP